jgi:beta-phosphoglucomutase-like phosphatase (HAD superfamily)
MCTDATMLAAERPLDALLFGSIGSLVHCSELQWRHFNQALMEKVAAGELVGNTTGTDVEWDRETYVQSLTCTGGKKRLADFFAQKGIHAKEGLELAQVIESLHVRKSEMFVEHIAAEAGKGFVLRPGVKALLEAAQQAGVQTAFVTCTVDAVMRSFVDHLGLTDLLDLTLSEKNMKEWGGQGKPAPHCYRHALLKLSETPAGPPARVLCVEDTWISLQSPLQLGGVATLALPSEWSVDQDFTQATKHIRELTDLAPESDGAQMLQKLGQVVDEVVSAKLSADGAQKGA